MKKTSLAAAVITVLTIGSFAVIAQQASPAANMSFFVTSSNPRGGNLGGLAGADKLCQTLASAVGAGNKTWRAYLSTSTVDAKSRIGNGPWHNVKGELIAQNVADLHSPNNKLTAATALTEKGTSPVYLKMDAAGAVQRPEGQLAHDILTGTNEDGTKNAATCNNWTDGADATAEIGLKSRTASNVMLGYMNGAVVSWKIGDDISV